MTDDDAKALAAIFRPTNSTLSSETLDAIDANNARWFRDTMPKTALFQQIRAEVLPLVQQILLGGGLLVSPSQEPQPDADKP